MELLGVKTSSHMKAVMFLHSFVAFVCMALSLASTACSAAAVAINSVGATWDAYGDYLSVFSLTNASDEATSYSGYAPSEPIYTAQIRCLAHWSDEPVGWSWSWYPAPSPKSIRDVYRPAPDRRSDVAYRRAIRLYWFR